MSRPPENDEVGPREGETFLARWSRRKQSARAGDRDGQSSSEAGGKSADAGSEGHRTAALDAYRETGGKATQPGEPAAPDQPPPALTEKDFADVDFDKLDYHSDYSRFMQQGVPEGIRQKALARLWLSDPIFTQVDPFQDYAGDFTDAGTVPVGPVRTAYKVGRGFLTQKEASEWDRLGKPPVASAIAALPELVPSYRVRAATQADLIAMIKVQTSAIGGPGAAAYGPEIAQSWLADFAGEGIAAAIAAARHVEVAIADDDGAVSGFCCAGAETAAGSGTIEALFVAAGHSRRGIAGGLVARAEAALTALGLKRVQVVATRLSEPLLARHGYRARGARQFATRGGLEMEVIDMSKRLIAQGDVVIDAEDPDQPAIRAFFAASEAYMGALYPAESNHFVDAAALKAPNVLFLVARVESEALGCGAIVKAGDTTAEVKRMWVDPEARGLKLGRRLLDALEAAARADSVTALRLETGIAQPEALGLYRAAGFLETGPFGTYAPDPLSVFMQKVLR